MRRGETAPSEIARLVRSDDGNTHVVPVALARKNSRPRDFDISHLAGAVVLRHSLCNLRSREPQDLCLLSIANIVVGFVAKFRNNARIIYYYYYSTLYQNLTRKIVFLAHIIGIVI